MENEAEIKQAYFCLVFENETEIKQVYFCLVLENETKLHFHNYTYKPAHTSVEFQRMMQI